MRRLNVSVIGAGVFGGYHSQKVAQSDRTNFVGILDRDIERATAIGSAHGVDVLGSFDKAIEKSDAIIVATPPSTHFDLAMKAMDSGKHVLVEKPLAIQSADAETLVRIARSNELILQAGHQERMVFDAMGLFATDERPTAIHSVRAGPPTGRSMDVSVIDDLMIHDIDLALHLANAETAGAVDVSWTGDGDSIDRVSAVGTVNGCDLRLVADRQAPERQRQMRLVYPNGSVFIDFLSRNIENTTPYKFALDVSESIPDPLKVADEAFFAACLGQGDVPVTAQEARNAVGVAEQFRVACTPDRRIDTDQTWSNLSIVEATKD